MSPVLVEETVELDLTIHASSLPAPSARVTGIGLDYNGSQLKLQDPQMCAVSLTNICDTTTVWDCTAPWVC